MPACSPCAFSTALLPLLGHHTHLCLSWHSKYNTQRGREGLTQACSPGTSSSTLQTLQEKEQGEPRTWGQEVQAEHRLWLPARAAGRKSRRPKAQKETWKAWGGFSRERSGRGRACLEWSRMGHPHTGAEVSPGTARSPKG